MSRKTKICRKHLRWKYYGFRKKKKARIRWKRPLNIRKKRRRGLRKGTWK